MFEEVSYSHPFLSEVILRVDFPSPLASLRRSLPLSIASAAIERFPIREPREAFAQELKISKKEVQSRREEFTEWNFFGKNREKRLAISPGALFVSQQQYTCFEALEQDFFTVLAPVFQSSSELRVGRMGLRYINRIDPAGWSPFEWDELISPGLLGLLDYFADHDHLTRVFHIVEFRFDEIQVKFQFGIPNPDFPAPIRRPLFVLDLDASAHGLQNLDDLHASVLEAHDHIQTLFEQSITDGLRALMEADRP